MKSILIVIAAVFFLSTAGKAQSCETFVLSESDKTAEYVNKDKKGKVQSYHSQQLLEVREDETGIVYEILQISKDKKQEELSRDTLHFTCAEDGMFYVDMSSYIDESQTEDYEEAQISFEFENIGYPSDLKVGSQLDDGSVTFTVDMGMMAISNETRISNRKVEAREKVTTEAGTFDCFKISQEVGSKMGFVTVKVKTVSWISKGVGTVKSESYDSGDNLVSSSELVSLK